MFTAGEQEFYATKGFQDDPKRCKPCREARKQRGDRGGERGSDRGAGPVRSDGYRESNGHGVAGSRDEHAGNGGGNGGFGGGGFGGGGRREREMHEITCSRCGKPARVPFRPTAGRPVFCRDCFNQRGADL
jgi:CxxC-x17-CxxC domain-containing protein